MKSVLPFFLTIPGIRYRMGAMIIAEIGDFSRFDSADKILAYAGISPSTYQSGQLDNSYSHMEKRGFRYLRYALYNATKYVCHWDDISWEETLWRKTLQCCFIPRNKEACSADFCNGKIRTSILTNRLTFFYKCLLFRAPMKMLLLSCDFQGTNISEMCSRSSFIKSSF